MMMKQAMIDAKQKAGMSKQEATKAGTEEAAKTWNKRMKGTGQTVGRGRN